MPEINGRRVRGVWPDPKANNQTRYRHMVHEYRAVAEELQEMLTSIDPRLLEFLDVKTAEAVQEALTSLKALDEQYIDWGEMWQLPHPPELVYDDDDWVRTTVAAKLLGVAPATLNVYRSNGHLLDSFYASSNQGYIVRVGGVRELLRKMPGHGWRAGRKDKVAHADRTEVQPGAGSDARGVEAVPGSVRGTEHDDGAEPPDGVLRIPEVLQRSPHP